MASKVKLGIPLLIVLALTMTVVVLPTKSATAAGIRCFERKTVRIEGFFNTVFTTTNIPPPGSNKQRDDIFGFAGFPPNYLFVDNKPVGSTLEVDEIANSNVTPTTITDDMNLTTINGEIIIKTQGTEGPGVGNVFTSTGTGTIIGGTDDYRGAKGEIRYKSVLNFNTREGTFEFEGFMRIRVPCPCK
jgi:hypothetical protein